MKIFTRSQIVELDRYTMEHEPIRSIDLMERSAKALTQAIMEMWSARTPIVVFAGPGNNGGDALAVARLLAEKDYQVSAYLFNISNHLSEDCIANQQRIKESKKVKEFVEVTTQFDPPVLEANMVVVDGLFGSGINKPLAGGFASLVKYINTSPSTIVSIDIPSGLMPEDNTYNISANTIKADYTLTLQQKKLAFLFADNQQFIGKLKVLDIRLSKDFINKTESQYYLTEENDVRSKIKERDDFAHKGTMGSALIIAGSYGMAGASILASRACLRSGAGKVVVHTPKKNYSIMQTAVPEAVMHMDHEETYFSQAIDTEDFEALGIGHPKEFERIAGTACNGDYERLSKAQELAQNLQAYIILKGHYSALCMPNGRVIFNSTGNSGMATAGSGDVLTGIITALLARGYDQADACIVGMYLHGLAGDLAAKDKGKESLIAGDIIEYLPNAFKRLTE